MPHVKEIWVFPVKSCQGTRVSSSNVVSAGLELDRVWCVVDADGDRYPAGEFLSQRKLPALATIGVAIGADALTLSAPGMPPLFVPIAEEAYTNNEDVKVICGGISTTDPEGSSWVLGTPTAKSAGAEAEAWMTKYVNEADAEKRKKPQARFMLVRLPRSQERTVSRFAGPNLTGEFKGIPGADCSLFTGVRSGDKATFHDFAPFLMTSQSSVNWLNKQMETEGYPILPFRGSIVVDGCEPWEEEEWLEFKMGPFRFQKIKECPRCSVPTRCQTTGKFLFSGGSFNGVKGPLLAATQKLGKCFPDKAGDPEWGSWKGPVMGVYVGHDGEEGVLEEGAEIVVIRRRSGFNACSVVAPVAALSAALVAFLVYGRTRQ